MLLYMEDPWADAWRERPQSTTLWNPAEETPSSPPDSPDAFGSFETGLNVDPWGHSTSGETDPWGEDSGVEVVGEHVDEWEAVKQSKERQDRHVVR